MNPALVDCVGNSHRDIVSPVSLCAEGWQVLPGPEHQRLANFWFTLAAVVGTALERQAEEYIRYVGPVREACFIRERSCSQRHCICGFKHGVTEAKSQRTHCLELCSSDLALLRGKLKECKDAAPTACAHVHAGHEGASWSMRHLHTSCATSLTACTPSAPTPCLRWSPEIWRGRQRTSSEKQDVQVSH